VRPYIVGFAAAFLFPLAAVLIATLAALLDGFKSLLVILLLALGVAEEVLGPQHVGVALLVLAAVSTFFVVIFQVREIHFLLVTLGLLGLLDCLELSQLVKVLLRQDLWGLRMSLRNTNKQQQ